MLEVIIAYVGLTFLWAYLYSKSPDPSTISGIAFRILYLGLTLFTVYELLSLLVIYVQVSGLPQNIANLVISYMSVMNYVIFLIFALVIIFLIVNNILPLFKKEEE
jgi:large-conductance mechanosensitive channel